MAYSPSTDYTVEIPIPSGKPCGESFSASYMTYQKPFTEGLADVGVLLNKRCIYIYIRLNIYIHPSTEFTFVIPIP